MTQGKTFCKTAFLSPMTLSPMTPDHCIYSFTSLAPHKDIGGPLNFFFHTVRRAEIQGSAKLDEKMRWDFFSFKKIRWDEFDKKIFWMSWDEMSWMRRFFGWDEMSWMIRSPGGLGGGSAPGLGIINFRGRVRFKWDRLSPGGLGWQYNLFSDQLHFFISIFLTNYIFFKFSRPITFFFKIFWPITSHQLGIPRALIILFFTKKIASTHHRPAPWPPPLVWFLFYTKLAYKVNLKSPS